MKLLRQILKSVVIVFFIVAVFLFFYLPTLATSGKPQGNRLAILGCRLYLNKASLAKTNGPNFEFSKLSNYNQRRALGLVLNNLDFLVKTNFTWGTSSNREIVIVCPSRFDNVPTPTLLNLYHKHPAHAVGYSDGTTELISPVEFTNLNLKGFASAWYLATNSEVNASK
jgi:hypothetical protein